MLFILVLISFTFFIQFSADSFDKKSRHKCSIFYKERRSNLNIGFQISTVVHLSHRFDPFHGGTHRLDLHRDIDHGAVL